MVFVNKKIPIAIGIAVVAIVIAVAAAKAYFGDSATELPAEEKVEKSLNLQEKESEENERGESGEAAESGG